MRDMRVVYPDGSKWGGIRRSGGRKNYNKDGLYEKMVSIKENKIRLMKLDTIRIVAIKI